MIFRGIVRAAIALAAILTMVGCQPGVGAATAEPGLSPAAVTGAATQTQSVTATTPAASGPTTAAPTVVVVPPLTTSASKESVSSEPVPAATVSANVVTVDASGGAVTLSVGQSFGVNLPSDYVWTVQVGDPAVLSPIQGDQYKATAAGETIMILDGAPICQQANPPCGVPSVRRTLQVSVR